jgi:methionyl-tRNA formyltransferase
MRTVLVSQDFLSLRGMFRACLAAGHTPVAALATRSHSARGGRSSAERIGQVEAILASAPSGMDLVVVDDVDQLTASVEGYRPDLLLVCGFPWRLPENLLALARYGSVNLHPSILPELRGPFPVHWAIRRGDRTLGVTAHRMEADYDTGPVLASVRFEVPVQAFGSAIWMRVGKGVQAVVGPALERAAQAEAGEPQSAADATYAGPFTPQDGVVDWSSPAASIHDLVRAWSLGGLGSAGPVAELNGELVRLHRTSITPADGVRVDCADGPIWLVDHVPADLDQEGMRP